tara:strand:- start:200 stop:640 length:441 start_codon:yes stop_codon:yes gene_type:complete
MASKKLKKLLKKVGKAAVIGGAGYAAMKGLQNRKRDKAIDAGIKAADADKDSDMMSTPYENEVSLTPKSKPSTPAKKKGTIAGDYSGIVDYGADIDVSGPSTPRKKLNPGPRSVPLVKNAGFKSGGRVKGCGKALRGFGRAMKGKK